MSSVMDVWNSITGIFTTADWITLAIMAIVAIGAGVVMQELGAIVTTTIVALIVFALAVYARAVLLGGQNAAQLADKNWHGFLGLPIETVIAYAIPFAVVIAVVHGVRSAVWH
ncbi:MAG TPA: hypothetical protein VLW75_05490 [Rhizomicrobium sp.]|nr:hypothetical protein [Rhizomicrobium sp.]